MPPQLLLPRAKQHEAYQQTYQRQLAAGTPDELAMWRAKIASGVFTSDHTALVAILEAGQTTHHYYVLVEREKKMELTPNEIAYIDALRSGRSYNDAKKHLELGS